jgi:hypothetical protein
MGRRSHLVHHTGGTHEIRNDENDLPLSGDRVDGALPVCEAGMIGTDQVSTAASVQSDRSVVLNYLSRSQTVNELQALGLDPQTARDRVAAMTDDEVGTLAGQINAVPAGADAGAVLLLVVVIWAIWYFAFRR